MDCGILLLLLSHIYTDCESKKEQKLKKIDRAFKLDVD